MCGVVGLIRKEQNVVNESLDILKRLEYRGYDSSGIAIIENNTLKVIKEVGKIENLMQACKEQNAKSNIIIGHTRWATHGKVTKENAHPHFSGKIAVIHNGIIENYAQLKKFLEDNGKKFKTQTDTEVIPVYIDFLMSKGDDFKTAFKKVIKELKGAYAIVAICQDEPDLMAFSKNGSPLVAGFADNAIILGSDAFSIITVASDILYFKDGDFGFASLKSIEIFDQNNKVVKREIVKSNLTMNAVGKDGYKHYMLKEIHDQPNILLSTINHCFDEKEGFSLDAISKIDLSKVKRISIIACGTSYYAGLVASSFFEKYAKIPCESYIASEFRYKDAIIEQDTLYIAISQSGETADTIGAIKYIKEHNAKVLSIVNTEESTMQNMSDAYFKLNCGPEIAVASTKVFNSQILCIKMLALDIAARKKLITIKEISAIVAEWRDAILDMSHKLNDKSWIENIQKISHKLREYSSMLYLGRGISYSLAMEGSLKMKELSYIHSEALPAGELKHGTIALIDKNIPVVCAVPSSNLFDKTASNIENIFSRDGRVVLISDKAGCDYFSKFSSQTLGAIEVKAVSANAISIAYSLPMQLLAYFTALEKGSDIDQPRNLAKSVTVE